MEYKEVPVSSRAAVAREIALWCIAAFLVYVFLRQGIAKFSDTSGWANAFRVWHYPPWFRILIGVAEVAAALLLLIPRVAFAGAVIIIVVMVGGMATHLWWGHPGHMTSEVLPLALALTTAIGRRRAFLLWPREERAA